MSILPSTEINYTGIIPFGSNDPSILLQNSLTSQSIVEAETAATGALVGTGHTFDSVLGCIPSTSGSIKFATLDSHTTLETGCQISFEIESEFIATPRTDVAGSEGFDHTAADHILSWADADGGPNYGRIFVGTNERLTTYFNAGGAGDTITETTNLGANRFKRITMSQLGSVVNVYADGALISSTSGVYSLADMFKNFYIGDFRGDGVAGGLTHYIRNLIISNRPVMIPVHPSAASIPFGGDSFCERSFPGGSGTASDVAKGYDHTSTTRMKGWLGDRGVGINFVDRGLGGAVVNTTSGTEWLTTADGISFLADNAVIKVLRLGTNDAQLVPATFATIDFDTDYKALITAVMATTAYLVIGTVPTVKTAAGKDNADYVSQVAACNSTINSIVDWWDTNNPARVGAIRVNDLFNAMGGEDPDTDMFSGSWAGTYADLHPSSRGYRVQGESIAPEIYFFLNGA